MFVCERERERERETEREREREREKGGPCFALQSNRYTEIPVSSLHGKKKYSSSELESFASDAFLFEVNSTRQECFGTIPISKYCTLIEFLPSALSLYP